MKRGGTVLVAMISSLVTAAVMVLAAPSLIYPSVAGMMRPELQRLEARLTNGAAGAGRLAVPVKDGGGSAPPLELPAAAAGSGRPPLTAVTVAAEKAGPSVVGVVARQTVETFFGTSVKEAGGSGVVVDARGFVATNHHVIDGASEITVILPDGRRLPARLAGSDRRNDVAVLKIEAKGLAAAELGDSDLVRIGDLAIAIGNPVDLSFQRTVTAGIVSGLNRSLYVGDGSTPLEVIQTDAAISPGNSGGPLVNALGQVIGINTAKISLPDVEGMGFAIPINRVRTIVEQIIASGAVTWSWLGVNVVDREQIAGQNLDIRLERGIYVASVVPGSPAEAAGIREGDVILSIAGRPVDSFSALRRILEARRVGERVPVVIERAGRRATVVAVLAARPEDL